MDDILTCFKLGGKITVMVRVRDKPTADFTMTDDDPNAVIAMVQRRQAETVAAQPGLDHCGTEGPGSALCLSRV